MILNNRTAAHLLGLAIKELVVDSLLLKSEASSASFKMNFATRQPLPPEFLSLLEEKMRELAKTASFQFLEMVPSNAAAFLRAKGEKLLAELVLDHTEETISIIHSGRYFDINLGLPSKFAIPFFALLNVESRDGNVSIFGVTGVDREALKKCVKYWKRLPKIVEELESARIALIRDETTFLLPRGQELLLNLFKQVCQRRAPRLPIFSVERDAIERFKEEKARYFSWSNEAGDLAFISPSEISSEFDAMKDLADPNEGRYLLRFQKGRIQKEMDLSEIEALEEEFLSKKGAKALLNLVYIDLFGNEMIIAQMAQIAEEITSRQMVSPIEYLVRKQISAVLGR